MFDSSYTENKDIGNLNAQSFKVYSIRRSFGMEEKTRLTLTVQAIIICLFCIAVLAGAITTMQDVMPASSTVGGRELPIYCVDTKEKKVALSFDAAWGNQDTEKILEILKKHNLKVTFFMTGGWVKEYPDDVKAIAAAGHDLGNHSENHKEMSKLTKAEIKQELMEVHNRVKELTGAEMNLFRPPYGDYNNQLIKTAASCGYYTIQWSVDSLDWKNYGVQDIVERVLNHKDLQPGAIILMHNGAKYTAQALEAVITGLQEKGYEIVPISELIYKEGYSMDESGKQIKNG